ncbi:MAG: NTP transferase domain-containing protein [Methylacidiphilales bacterium]|nr:NTP transferase domain-containing protein [Candidatus Methylacidiphilales bacterium]
MRTPSQITAVILAGGQGTRIRHLLPECPKPMALVLGRPFLEWIVRFLILQGIRDIILSTGYKAEQIESHFGASQIPGATIRCVREKIPRGTAGGFLEAIAGAATPDAWLICNGDSLVLTSLGPLFETLRMQTVAGALLGIPVGDASNYGTLECDSQGTLHRFAEKRPGRGLVNAGVYLFRCNPCNGFPDGLPLSFEKDVFPRLLADKAKLHVVPATGPFLDIGTPKTFGLAERFIAGNPAFFSPAENHAEPSAILS